MHGPGFDSGGIRARLNLVAEQPMFMRTAVLCVWTLSVTAAFASSDFELKWTRVARPSLGLEASCPSECLWCAGRAVSHAGDATSAAARWIEANANNTGATAPLVPTTYYFSMGDPCGNPIDAHRLEVQIDFSSLSFVLALMRTSSPNAQRAALAALTFLSQTYTNGASGVPLRASGPDWVYSRDGVITVPDAPGYEGYVFETITRLADSEVPPGTPTLTATLAAAWGASHFAGGANGSTAMLTVAASIITDALQTARVASAGRRFVPEVAMPAADPGSDDVMAMSSVALLQLFARNFRGCDLVPAPLVLWAVNLTAAALEAPLCDFLTTNKYLPQTLHWVNGSLVVHNASYDVRTNVLAAGAFAGELSERCQFTITSLNAELIYQIAERSGMNRSDASDPRTATYIVDARGEPSAELSLLLDMAIASELAFVSNGSQVAQQLNQLAAHLAPSNFACMPPSMDELTELATPEEPSCRGLWGSTASTALLALRLANVNIFTLPKPTWPPTSTVPPSTPTPSNNPTPSSGTPSTDAPTTPSPASGGHKETLVYIIVGVGCAVLVAFAAGILIRSHQRRRLQGDEHSRILSNYGEREPSQNLGFY
jgi:hypothetical protein